MSLEQSAERLLKRLDIIILLLLESSGEHTETTSGKIEKLLSLGLSNSEVAAIIGKPVKYVTAVTSKKRKAKQKGTIKK